MTATFGSRLEKPLLLSPAIQLRLLDLSPDCVLSKGNPTALYFVSIAVAEPARDVQVRRCYGLSTVKRRAKCHGSHARNKILSRGVDVLASER